MERNLGCYLGLSATEINKESDSFVFIHKIKDTMFKQRYKLIQKNFVSMGSAAKFKFKAM